MLCNVIESISNHKLFTEYPVRNSFKFDDIFNDLSIHEFKTGDKGFAETLSEPDYTGCGSELT